MASGTQEHSSPSQAVDPQPPPRNHRSAVSPWTTTSSREVYINPWIRVREDSVVRPDGQPGIYGVVSMQRPSVFVVALTDEDEVLTIEQYRYAPGATSLEVPAGGCDDDTPLQAAQRELLEETGYQAAHWQQIGRMNALNGVCDAPEYVFLARGLNLANPQDSSSRAIDTAKEQITEGITAVRAVPWSELMRVTAEGGISDGETVAALMFAAITLGRVS